MSNIDLFDEHTFNFESGPVTNEQFLVAIKSAIRMAEEKLGRSLPCEVRSNIIFTKDGKPTTVGFAWVSNPEVYWILLGFNPDGSDRFEYADSDSDGKAEVDVPMETFSATTSWADIMDEETEELAKRTKVKLPPLVAIEPIPLTKEQSEKMNRTSHPIHLKRAFVAESDEGFRHNVLFCPAAPAWLTGDDVKALLNVYSTSKKPTFPIVKVTKGQQGQNRLLVTFDSANRDAQFALHMIKRLTVSKRVNGKEQTQVIFFSLARDPKYNPDQ